MNLDSLVERRLNNEPDPMPEIATVALFHCGKILMGRRRDDGKWTVPGGHLKEGEPAIVGALRELHEETGIRAPALNHIYSCESDGRIIHCFKATTNDGHTYATRDPDKEVDSWSWIPCEDGLPEQIVKNLHIPASKNIIFQELGFV